MNIGMHAVNLRTYFMYFEEFMFDVTKTYSFDFAATTLAII